MKVFDEEEEEEEERLLRVSRLGGGERIQDQEHTILMEGDNNTSEGVAASVLKVHDQGVEIPETAHQISTGLSLF